MRTARTTGPGSSAPPKEQASSFTAWRRAARPCALCFTLAGMLAGGFTAGSAYAQTAGAKAPAPSAPAATANAAPDPAKVPLIEDLFKLTKPDNMMVQAKNAIGNAAQQAFTAEVKKFDNPSKYQADYQKLQGQLMGIIDSRLDWTKMKPQLVKIYSDSFTKDELVGIAAFYRSPAGQAEMKKMPEVAYKTNMIGQQQLASVQPELQKAMSDALTAIKQKSQAARPATPAPATPKP